MPNTKFFIKNDGKVIETSIDMRQAVKLYTENPYDTYPVDFYRSAMKSRDWQVAMGEIIGKMYNVKSAVDFGCGLGYYLEGFWKSGAKVKGYEISYRNAKDYISKSILSFIEEGNVMEAIRVEQTFQLSMSIEVAEHILPDKSEVFIDNLTNASERYVMLTAAPPGQGGVCHINERDMSYWIGLMNKRGFKIKSDIADKIREKLNELPYRGKYYSIIKRHITMFERT